MMMMINEDEYGNHSFLSKKSKKSKNKRFNDEQIRSLENIFQSESKLEPRKKLQLARELGLQPRQVAIWFQNKRARYKSKQLEHEYSVLHANYNNMAAQFETLKKEKQALQSQLRILNEQLKKSQEGNRSNDNNDTEDEIGAKTTNASKQKIDLLSDDDSSNKTDNYGLEEEIKPTFSFEKSYYGVGVLSDEDSSIKAEYLGLEEETELLNMVDPAELLDRCGSSYQWWDVWP